MIVGPSPRGAWMYVCLSSVFILSCVGGVLVMGRSPVNVIQPFVYSSENNSAGHWS
jgi:hypothetical protein